MNGEKNPRNGQNTPSSSPIARIDAIEKKKRHVDHYRPIRDWKEQQVWEIIEKYRVRVHPCYYMGWSRCSCKFCIFGNRHQFASSAFVSPELTKEIIRYENEFGVTINRKCDLQTLIHSGKKYPHITTKLKQLATNYDYGLSVIIPKSELWRLPAGAYGENCGPS